MPIPSSNQNAAPPAGPFREELIWQQLKTVHDPEIPINIVDLGLVYAAEVTDSAAGGKRIGVRMTLTAPGCPMSDVIKAEVERKLASLPEVKEVRVDVVFDPPWDKNRMSEAARLQLGFDTDDDERASSRPGAFKIVR